MGAHALFHGMGRETSSERDQEAEEALFSFYVSALSYYGRFHALLLLAYVAYCGHRHEAHAMRQQGKRLQDIAHALEVSIGTAHALVHEPLPTVPAWAECLLSELRQYSEEDVAEELLCAPWGVAC